MGRDRRFLDASGRRLRVAGGGYTAAKEAAEKALELEPELAEAHTARGKVLGWYEWKFAEGELALRRAVAPTRTTRRRTGGWGAFFRPQDT